MKTPVLSFGRADSSIDAPTIAYAYVLIIEDWRSQYPVTTAVKAITVSVSNAPYAEELSARQFNNLPSFTFPRPMPDLTANGCLQYKIEVSANGYMEHPGNMARVFLEYDDGVILASSAIKSPSFFKGAQGIKDMYLNFNYSGTYVDSEGALKLFLAFDVDPSIRYQSCRITVGDSDDLESPSFSGVVSFDDIRSLPNGGKILVVKDMPVKQDVENARPITGIRSMIRLTGTTASGPADFLVSTDDCVRLPYPTVCVHPPECTNVRHIGGSVTCDIAFTTFPEFAQADKLVVHVGNQITAYYDGMLRGDPGDGTVPGRVTLNEKLGYFRSMASGIGDDGLPTYSEDADLRFRCMMDAICYEVRGGSAEDAYWVTRTADTRQMLSELESGLNGPFAAILGRQRMVEQMVDKPGEAIEIPITNSTTSITIPTSVTSRYTRVHIQPFDVDDNGGTPATFLVARPFMPASVEVDAAVWAAARFIIEPYLTGDEYSGPGLEFIVEIHDADADTWSLLPTTFTRDGTTHIHIADLTDFTGSVETRVRGVIGEEESDETLDVPPFARPTVEWSPGEGQVVGEVVLRNFPTPTTILARYLVGGSPFEVAPEWTTFEAISWANIEHHDMLTHLIIDGVEIPVADIGGSSTFPPYTKPPVISVSELGLVEIAENPWMSSMTVTVARRFDYQKTLGTYDSSVQSDTYEPIQVDNTAAWVDGKWVWSFPAIDPDVSANIVIYTATCVMHFGALDSQPSGAEAERAQTKCTVASYLSTQIIMTGDQPDSVSCYFDDASNGSNLVKIDKSVPIQLGFLEFAPLIHHMVLHYADGESLTIPQASLIYEMPFVYPVNYLPDVSLESAGNAVSFQVAGLPHVGKYVLTVWDYDTPTDFTAISVNLPLAEGVNLPPELAISIIDGVLTGTYTSTYATSEVIVAIEFVLANWSSVARGDVTWPSVRLGQD